MHTAYPRPQPWGPAPARSLLFSMAIMLVATSLLAQRRLEPSTMASASAVMTMISDTMTWYVAPGGNDTNDCLTPATACLTIGAAIGKAGDGDTIAVAAGTYAENLSLTKDLTILGAGRDSTIVDGGGNARVIHIQPGVKVTLADLTVQNGAIRLDWAFRTTSAQPPGRTGHTATDIYDNILVAGGVPATNQGGPLADAWLYNTLTKTWRQAASMRTPRSGHIGIRLNDGSVVVAGGFGPSGVLTSVERYYPDNPYIPDDPPEGHWVEMAPLPEGHSIYSAVLLHTHEIMVVGGLGAAGNDAPLASAAIYNPANNTWRSAAPLPRGRWRHTMTLLDDGTVLVAGGTTDNSATWLNESLRYDPRADTWTPTATPMTSPRIYHAAALLHDGRVLVAGGPGLKSAEIFDPATNRWTRAADMAAPRWLHSLTTMFNEDILVAGGFDEALAAQGGSGVVLGGEIYHPETNTWHDTGMMITPRLEHTAVRYNRGEILFVGGRGEANDGATGLAEVEHYAPSIFRHTDLGAGIYVDSGAEVTLRDSIVRDNHSDYGGGGIANLGTLRLERSEVRENEAAVYPGGAGILNDQGVVELKDSLIAANYSAGGSVGINGGGGTITLDNSRVENNILNGRNCCAVGGGIAVTNGRLTLINNSEVRGNWVIGGPGQSHSAGIFIGGSNGILTMRNSRVRDNHVLVTSGFSAIGGGIYLDQGGGASTGYLIDSEVSGNTVTNLSGQQSAGSGIVVDESILVMTRTLVLNNQTFGGPGGSAGIANLAGTMNVYDSAIIGNRAGADGALADGGGVYNLGTAVVSGTLISGNSASGSGGALLNSGTLVVNGGAISENTATANGGGIGNGPGAVLTLNGVTISRNSAAYYGGGIFNHGTLTLSQSTVGQNALIGTDRPSSGGGIMNGNDAQLTLDASAVISNTVAGMPTSDGGGSGGGISSGNALIQNSTISGNQAPRGGGIYNVNELTLFNSTVTSNTATHQTGGIYARTAGGDTIVISNTIVAGNIDQLADDGLYPDCSGVFPSQGHNLIGAVNPTACTFTATTGDQVGTLAAPLDPRLGPLAANGGPTPTHALLPGSPAIDKVPADACPPADQRGAARPYGPFCDVGAHELNAPLSSGLNLADDAYMIENPAGVPDFNQFYEDFDFAATTHLITESHVLSDINALNGLNLPIGLAEIDIQSVLPLDLTNDPTLNGQLVPNPSAYLYLQIVRSIYDDEELRYYDGTIRSGLCAGMASTVADFASGESQRDPAEFGGDGRVVTIPDSPALRKHIQLFQGRQLGSQVLNYLANEGTHDAVGLYAHLAARIGTPDWLRNPELIGITKGANCADFEVGHALLPYSIDTVNGKGRIFVYDPNYPPTPLASRAENHFIEIDFATNTWTYKLSDKAIWTAQTIYSMPLSLFRQQPILPAMTDTDVVMVNGGQRAAWGGQRAAWGGQRAAWGEVEDTGTRTGCYITPDGEIVFTHSITGSLRVFPLTGPRLPGPDGGPRTPEILFFPTGNDMTFTSAGGRETDLMLFGHQTTIGFLATADDQTIDNLDIDKTFHTVSIRTNETNSDKQFKLYQMHETKTDNPEASDTIAIAIQGNLRAGQTTTLSVSQDLENFTIINDGGSAQPFEIGISSIGPSAAVTVIYPDVPIGAGETWVITLPAPADLANATLTATVHRADGTIGTVPIQPATFPAASTRVRDQFDRANGELGSAWAGKTDEDHFAIRGHQVRVRDGGALYWKNRTFGRTQEAFITLRHVPLRAGEQGLLLKVQRKDGSINWKNGAIKVLYNPKTHEVRVETYQPNRSWRVVKRIAGVTFASGDQLGARALRDGMVEIYRNGLQIGIADTRITNGDFFARRGGWIGVWYVDARSATFDDFGGGTVR